MISEKRRSVLSIIKKIAGKSLKKSLARIVFLIFIFLTIFLLISSFSFVNYQIPFARVSTAPPNSFRVATVPGSSDPNQDEWPMFRGQLNHTGEAHTTLLSHKGLFWSYDTGYIVDSSPAVKDGYVYMGNLEGLQCLNATTGKQIWNYTLGYSVESSPAVAGGRVYVGSDDGKVYCLNATTGILLWNYTTGIWVESSPAVAGGCIYVGSDDYKIYCLNATTGGLLWQYATGNVVRSSPAVANGGVYVGSIDGKIYCLNGTTGKSLWNSTTGDYVLSSPAIARECVYMGSNDGKVYCLNATTGKQLWNYTLGAGVFSSPAVTNGYMYIGSNDGKIYCLNATSGKQLWNYTTRGWVESSPAVADGWVYVGSDDRNIYCLNATMGWLLWNYTTGGSVSSSPAVVDGRVYIGSDDGHLYCLPCIFINPTVPDAPQSLQATAGNGQIILTWKAPSSNGGLAIINYNIYRGTSLDNEIYLTTVSNILIYSNIGLTNGQPYYYKINAVNGIGEGPLSNEASATPFQNISCIFLVTAWNYTETENLTQAVQSEFGPDFRVADWDDLLAVNNIEQWATDIGMKNNDMYMVTCGGRDFYAGVPFHYYIQRFDHNVPSGWLVHDNLDRNFICLRSLYGLHMPILAIAGPITHINRTWNYNVFHITAGNHTEAENLTQVIQSEFGPNFRVADWHDLKAVNNIEQWATSTGMNNNDLYMVTCGGEEFWAGDRHYFIQRFDHNVPGGWLVHDDLENNFICLGSWNNTPIPILAIWNGNGIFITIPSASTIWTAGSSQYIHWFSSGTTGYVNIDLYESGGYCSTIATGISDSGSYYWIIPSSLPPANYYQIKITDYTNSSLYGMSAAYFSISALPTPCNFSIYSPIRWVHNQTPVVIGRFYVGGSGINVTAVQYAYSTIGSLMPTNWAPVNGIYRDLDCLTPANNGVTGWFYARVTAVPFKQNSETLNTIRFRAADMAGTLGTQSAATIILIDNTFPILTNPVINPSNPKQGDLLNISVLAIDSGSGIASVILYYNIGNGWNNVTMNLKNGNYTTAIKLGSTTDLLKYYIVVTDNAGNIQRIGSQSAPETVEITKKSPDNLLIIIIIICIGAIAATSGVYITFKKRYSHSEDAWKRMKQHLKKQSKNFEGGLLPKWVKSGGLTEKLDYLMKKSVTIESIYEFQDTELNQFLKEPIQSLSPEDFELLQSEEFNELSREEKMEIKKDLVFLSKTEREEVLSKFKGLNEEVEDI